VKRLRRIVLWLSRLWNWRKRRDLMGRAVALNEELTRIEYKARSVRARETGIRRLAEKYPPAAVAAIAEVRGYRNLARIARRVTRELQQELAN